MRTSDDCHRPPYRWDLVAPDQLGSLLDGAAASAGPGQAGTAGLWFLPELARCAGLVLARSGDGDLYFVGRSLDSMYDLVRAALPAGPALHRLPFSLSRRSRADPALTGAESAHLRWMLSTVGLSPYGLARRRRPATIVDVVHSGGTFEELYHRLRRWITEEGESWPVIRRKLRFVGITSRVWYGRRDTWRWHRAAGWVRELPGSAVVNVAMHNWVWSYLADNQAKLTRTYHPDRWLTEPDAPRHDERTRRALAEGLAIVAFGRSADGRRAIARAMSREPALAEPWLRTLVGQLSSGSVPRQEVAGPVAVDLPVPDRYRAPRRARGRRRARRQVRFVHIGA